MEVGVWSGGLSEKTMKNKHIGRTRKNHQTGQCYQTPILVPKTSNSHYQLVNSIPQPWNLKKFISIWFTLYLCLLSPMQYVISSPGVVFKQFSKILIRRCKSWQDLLRRSILIPSVINRPPGPTAHRSSISSILAGFASSALTMSVRSSGGWVRCGGNKGMNHEKDRKMDCWLVVWNIFYFPIYFE